MTQLEQRFLTLVPQYLKEISDSLKILIKNQNNYDKHSRDTKECS